MEERQLTTAEELYSSLAADVDIFWLLFGSVLVFFMQTGKQTGLHFVISVCYFMSLISFYQYIIHAGFTMLEVGNVQLKNTKNILVKNVFDAALGSTIFWLWGYGIAHGDDEGDFVGTTFYGLKNFKNYGHWLFQWTYSATAVTIVSGAVAERITFEAYFLYAVGLSGLVYPFVVHWAWGGGFMSAARSDEKDELLFGCGVVDFAGSGVVHMTGGIAALVGIVLLGPRIGRFVEGSRFKLPDYAPIFQTLGTLIMFVGWFGFNGASTLAASGGKSAVAAKAMSTTAIAGSSACVFSVLFGRAHLGYVHFGLANNGLLAGLVAITAGCATVEMEGAFVIGVVSSMFFYVSTQLLKKFEIDDVVDAFPVHGACGIWGVIAAGLFTTENNYRNAYSSTYSDGGDRAKHCAGAFYGGSGHQLCANLILVLVIIAWVGGLCLIIFGAARSVGLLRAQSEKESYGMDYAHHSTRSQRELIKKENPDFAIISPDFVSRRDSHHSNGEL